MDSFGDFLLQNAFQIWSPKDRKPKIMKKPQQLRVFLFETCLVFSKIVGTKGDPSDYATRSTYVFKYRMMVNKFDFYLICKETYLRSAIVCNSLQLENCQSSVDYFS